MPLKPRPLPMKRHAARIEPADIGRNRIVGRREDEPDRRARRRRAPASRGPPGTKPRCRISSELATLHRHRHIPPTLSTSRFDATQTPAAVKATRRIGAKKDRACLGGGRAVRGRNQAAGYSVMRASSLTPISVRSMPSAASLSCTRAKTSRSSEPLCSSSAPSERFATALRRPSWISL